MRKVRAAFKKNSAIFIPFIMAGHPSKTTTLHALRTLAEKGAGIIELGVPFSDPVADGPINQRAAEIGLNNGASLAWCLSEVKRLRENGCHTPIVLMSYLNPILAMGIELFAVAARAAGVDAMLIVDLPPEEGVEIFSILRANNIDIVLMVSPTTEPARFYLYQQIDPAFIYYISRLGVTGLHDQLPPSLEQEVECVKEQIFRIPIAVGFGISTARQASSVAKIADGVVVGSGLVKKLDEGSDPSFTLLVEELVNSIKS